jgi:hypothetical protein
MKMDVGVLLFPFRFEKGLGVEWWVGGWVEGSLTQWQSSVCLLSAVSSVCGLSSGDLSLCYQKKAQSHVNITQITGITV